MTAALATAPEPTRPTRPTPAPVIAPVSASPGGPVRATGVGRAPGDRRDRRSGRRRRGVDRLAPVGPATTGPAPARPAAVRPTGVRPAAVRPAAVRPARGRQPAGGTRPGGAARIGSSLPAAMPAGVRWGDPAAAASPSRRAPASTRMRGAAAGAAVPLRLTVRGARLLLAMVAVVVVALGMSHLAGPAASAGPLTGLHVAPGVALGHPAAGAPARADR